jgi:hypothetical protein
MCARMYMGTDITTACSSEALVEDKIAVILGYKYPISLQPKEGGCTHAVLGEAYVHGFMTEPESRQRRRSTLHSCERPSVITNFGFCFPE